MNSEKFEYIVFEFLRFEKIFIELVYAADIYCTIQLLRDSY